MVKLYVTYGNGYLQRNCYSVVEAEDYAEAFDTLNKVTGGKYAFAYDEHEFAGQIERHGLCEIPLMPQSKAFYDEQED